ncbi:hypothetical protein Bca4012_042898 [Brassica carinata]
MVNTVSFFLQDVCGGNSNNGFSTKKKLGYNNNNGYYGGYYPQAYHTSNGNKKLNAAYNEAAGDKSSCPVFLIFSVNTSEQFVGLAEMCHIVKDIPNSSLRHITLENDENKHVTNSRDTQEVKIEQGVRNCENIIKDGKKKHQLYKRQQSFTASDKKATPKDKFKETSVIAEVAEEISQNDVAEVASTLFS